MSGQPAARGGSEFPRKAGRSRHGSRAGGRGHLRGAASRPDRPPGVVHVRLRQQHSDSGTAGAGPALPQETPVLDLRLRQLPAVGQQRRRPRTRCCDGFARTRSPDCRARRSASRRGPTPGTRTACYSPPPSPHLATPAYSSPPSPSAASPFRASPSPTSPVSSSTSSHPRSRAAGGQRDQHGLGIVEQRDLRRSAQRLERDRVADLRAPRRRSGASRGCRWQRLDVTSRATCSSTPPSLTPGNSSAPVSSMTTVEWIACSRRDPQQVDVHRVAGHGVAGELLEHHGRGAAVDAQLDHGAGVRRARGADRARRPRTKPGLAAAEMTAGTFPERRRRRAPTGSGGLPLLHREGCGGGGGHGSRRW